MRKQSLISYIFIKKKKHLVISVFKECSYHIFNDTTIMNNKIEKNVTQADQSLISKMWEHFSNFSN